MLKKIFFNILLAFIFLFAFAGSPRQATVIAAPANFNKVSPTDGATGVSNSAAVLSWTASSPDVTYQYCLRQNAKPKCPARKWVTVPAAAGTQVTLQSLTPNTLYRWQVRAVSKTDGTITSADIDPNTGNDTWWTFRTTNTVGLPGAFGKLTPADLVTDASVNGLSLTWEASTNTTSYEYCYDTVNDNNCNTAWVSTGLTRSATLNSLLYSQDYFWQVRAVNANGNVQADYGDWFTFTTTFGPPAAFSKQAPLNTAIDQPLNLTLEWDPSAGQNFTYEYCWDATGGADCQNKITWTSAGTDTSVAITVPTYETTYSWQVRAMNQTGTTPANAGAYWTFTTTIAPPGSFGKTSPGNAATDQPVNPTLTWETSAGQNITYEYCYVESSTATTCPGPWFPTQAGATQASLAGLKYNTDYSWQARAINSTGTTYANGGTLWRFHTQIAPPDAFSKLIPPDGDSGVPVNLTLTWSPSAGAADYLFCLDPVDLINDPENNQCNSGWEVKPGASTTVTVPAHNATYYWQVKARNAEGEIGANNDAWWSFTTRGPNPAGFSKLSPLNASANVPLTPWMYWTASAESLSYQYCIHTTATCPSEAAWKSAGTGLSFQVPGSDNLLINTTYYWQVRATNIVGTTEADAGSWYSFTTLKLGPSSSNQNFNNAVEDTTYHGTLTYTTNYPATTIFSRVGSPPPGILVLDNTGAFSYTPPADFQGSVTFDFIISDGYNPPTPSYTATIQVQGVNDAPVLSFIPDQVALTGQPVTFTASATDADTPYGDYVTLDIVETLPAGASFNPTTGVFYWLALWSPAHPGPYSFTVRATDQTSVSDTQVVQVTVNPLRIFLPKISR